MTFDRLWNLFIYIFRIFKEDRRPEYLKVEEDEIELEYGRLNDCDTPVYSFVIVRDD